MPALLDTLDRFSHTSTSIRLLASSHPPRPDPGPFTAAILQLTPRDMLRDADEAEYGLFTFLRDATDAPMDGLAPLGKIGRREFRGATPLRGKRVGASTIRDEEPEVYVEAALKYLDRFHTVKPMPHSQAQLEAFVDRLNSVRDNIERLQASLDQNANSGRASPQSQTIEEERRISELKSRILQLRKRKDALSSKLPVKPKTQLRARGAHVAQPAPPRRSFDSTSSSISTPTSPNKPNSKPTSQLPARSRMSGPPKGKTIPKDRTPSEEPDEGEHLFWSGGKPSKFALDDTAQSSSLLDEKLDMSGLDMLMSPTPSTPGPSLPLDDAGAGQANESTHFGGLTNDHPEDEGDDSDSEEPTVVVSKLVPRQPAVTTARVPPSPPPSRPPSKAARPELQTPVQDEKTTTVPPSTRTKVNRVRITAEVERICAKIWSTISDLLVPGNNFSLAGKKPPNARDTLAVLQAISAQSFPGPSPDSTASPSTRSTLSSLLGIETLGPAGGSPHQIMTAQVLLSLLTAPNHAMPLTALKTLLASKTAVPSPGPDAGREAKQNAAALGASAAQAGTRALYGCVAKKLVKIDRGGGEQVVRFD